MLGTPIPDSPYLFSKNHISDNLKIKNEEIKDQDFDINGQIGFTRTKSNFEFTNLFLFDFDPNEDTPINCRPKTPEEYIDLLSKVWKPIKNCRKVITYSSSSNLYLEDKPLGGTTPKFHIYIEVLNPNDIPRFNNALKIRCWLKDYGWNSKNINGDKLGRTIFDTVVASPERIIYEANPILNNGITQKNPASYYIEGNALDTSQLLNQSDDELDTYICLAKPNISKSNTGQLLLNNFQIDSENYIYRDTSFLDSNQRKLTLSDFIKSNDEELAVHSPFRWNLDNFSYTHLPSAKLYRRSDGTCQLVEFSDSRLYMQHQSQHRQKRDHDTFEDALDHLNRDNYIDTDRNSIETALSRITDRIIHADIYKTNDDPYINSTTEHFLYMPEGSGKSRLAITLAKQGYNVAFCTCSNKQANEKRKEFSENNDISVVHFQSKEAYFVENFGVGFLRKTAPNPFESGRIDGKYSIKNISELSGKDSDLIQQVYDNYDVPYPLTLDDGKQIVVTTFSSYSILDQANVFKAGKWIIIFDDPSVYDVSPIIPYESNNNYSTTFNENENGFVRINDRNYWKRPTQFGESKNDNIRIYTSTERTLKKYFFQTGATIHHHMPRYFAKNITVLGTKCTRVNMDGIVPLVFVELKRRFPSLLLIADGLNSDLNHVNSKGNNTLSNNDLLVELSAPPESEFHMIYDSYQHFFGKAYISPAAATWEIKRDLIHDKFHQAVARNSGFRQSGSETVVLIEKQYFKSITEDSRYKISSHSVIIDWNSRTTKSKLSQDASELAITVDELLTSTEYYSTKRFQDDCDEFLRSNEGSIITRVNDAVTDRKKNATGLVQFIERECVHDKDEKIKISLFKKRYKKHVKEGSYSCKLSPTQIKRELIRLGFEIMIDRERFEWVLGIRCSSSDLI